MILQKTPLKVTVGDELGNVIYASQVTTSTYDSAAAYYASALNVFYFANTGSNKSLVLQKAGYEPNATTNTGLTDVSTNQTSQTSVTLDTSDASASAVTAGS